eukprot:CAMPEP_0202950350 /NCGR_PEP_ID=MMETSP1395-20130829/21651_1 /ASSEMBLY_ACC=CAM_ASM_000871 /TAXON_ID=5961 /ORGANISM="Blepharisma japonicum, Strain Stock R1072" /LENGTH=83 /DNA_ID=CAMNT_0049654719 /DNA_START=361 /DNA_END=612 /DNA_ORIENTATION=-
MYMKVNEKTTKSMDLGNTLIRMVQNMLANEKMINKMGTELKCGLMEQDMKDIIRTGRKMGRENLILQMGHGMKEILKITKLLG